MRNRTLKAALLLLLLIAGAASVLAEGSEADFKAAYAAAEAANKEAGSLRNQWTTTASMLAAAKKAGDAGDFDGLPGEEIGQNSRRGDGHPTRGGSPGSVLEAQGRDINLSERAP